MSKTITDLPIEMNSIITSFVKAKPDEELSIDELHEKIRDLQQLLMKKEKEEGDKIIKQIREEGGHKYIYVRAEKYTNFCEYKIPIEKFKSVDDLVPSKWGDELYSKETGKTLSVDKCVDGDDAYSINANTICVIDGCDTCLWEDDSDEEEDEEEE